MACKYYMEDGLCEMSGRCYFVVWFHMDISKASFSTRSYQTLGSAVGPPDKCPVQGQGHSEYSECPFYTEGS